MKKNTVSKTLKSPRTDFKINNFFEKGSFFETSSDFLILKPKADDITGTPLIFAFRLQTYVLDFSASLNDINISSFMVPVYLLKSGFQPQKHKRLVFDRTSQRFAISLLFACLKLTRNRLFCYFCPSFVLGVGSGNNKDISFSDRIIRLLAVSVRQPVRLTYVTPLTRLLLARLISRDWHAFPWNF